MHLGSVRFSIEIRSLKADTGKARDRNGLRIRCAVDWTLVSSYKCQSLDDRASDGVIHSIMVAAHDAPEHGRTLQQVAIRLPGEHVVRADALALARRSDLAQPTRSDVIRRALEIGLSELEMIGTTTPSKIGESNSPEAVMRFIAYQEKVFAEKGVHLRIPFANEATDKARRAIEMQNDGATPKSRPLTESEMQDLGLKPIPEHELGHTDRADGRHFRTDAAQRRPPLPGSLAYVTAHVR